MNARTPGLSAMDKRRRHFRFPTSLTVAVLFDPVQNRPTLHTVASDASAGGLTLESEYGDLEGAAVTLLVVPAIGPSVRGWRALRFRARVVWNHEVRSDRRGRRYRHGLQFLGYGSDDPCEFERWLARSSLIAGRSGQEAPRQSESGGLLLRLAAMAQSAGTARTSTSGLTQAALRARNEALRRAHAYFKELSAHLDVLKPAYPDGMYRVVRLPEFKGLVWRSCDVFLSTREIGSNDVVCTEVAFRYALSATNPIEVERDHPDNERLRRTLLENRLPFDVEDRRNDRNLVVSSRFAIECTVKASITIGAERDPAGLVVRMSNVGGFGATQARVVAEDIDTAWLDSLAEYVLGHTASPELLPDVACEAPA